MVFDFRTLAEARRILAKEDEEERNWRSARLEFKRLLDYIDEAWKTAEQLELRIRDQEQRVTDLDNTLAMETSARLKVAENAIGVRQLKLEGDLKVTEDNIRLKTVEFNDLTNTVAAATVAHDVMVGQRIAAERGLAEVELKLAQARADLSDIKARLG